ncbi:MAG: ATP-dependent DNA helicase RecG [Planctomycetaceae bacterium]|nr:ATP-dependent DNA helicase RecG [Planctomycetaceae bacterium]
MDPTPAPAERSPAELLATPVQFVRGVGPQRAEPLQRLGLLTARDLLFYFPRDYQDLTDLTNVKDLEPDKLVRLRGTVAEVDSRVTNAGRFMLGVLVKAGAGFVRCMWFDQRWLREKFSVGQDVLVTGKVRLKSLIWELVHPQVTWLDTADDEPGSAAQMLPVYGLTEGLTQGAMRRMMRLTLDAFVDLLDEVFPAEHLAEHNLWPIATALRHLHFPDNREQLAQARRRFVYQELLILQLGLAVQRYRRRQASSAPVIDVTGKIDARIRRLFPFELTAGQQSAILEIAADLRQPVPMNRLLQGDVGSGKTIVAVYAMLAAIAAGYQAVIMAPTEILARQHAATLGKILSHSQVRWGCLTGGSSTSERQELLAGLAAGTTHAVIGTHAVLQQDVQFAKLGLVVIDEQHKFGVRQRASLKQAGANPHYLVMTATPIPRSLALTLFGDLDVTTIRDAPPGRQPIHTYLAADEQRERWWEFVRKKLTEGRQAYVIAPLVDSPADAEATDAAEDADRPEGDSPKQIASAEAVFEALCHGPLEAFRVGLIHGRMSSSDKEAAMAAFRDGRTQVLVSTSVIEVGVDVPNATLMTIESAQRFGLSQLHQLRGRVSRGLHPGYCCLFTDEPSPEAQRRLEALSESTDGFALAEADFQIRGPGDLLGTRQHGLPPLRIADLVSDRAELEEARQAAQAMVSADPGLSDPAVSKIRRMLLHRYGRVMDLGDVG